MASQKRSLYEYDNFRTFLRDYYLSEKARDKKFSFRFFSRIAGFKSTNFLNLVMKGKSNISEESVVRLVAAMKLNQDEANFFSNLVKLNQSTTTGEKQSYARELMRSRGYRKMHPLDESQYDYFAKWYLVVVRALVGLPEFREDHNWIARKVSPPITAAEAKQALGALEAIGLIGRDGRGCLRQTNKDVATPNEVTGAPVAQFHREMMKRASESIDRVPREKRDLSAMTVGVSRETAQKIKEMVQSFRKEIVDLVSQDDTPTQIYQLNFHIFPVSKEGEDEG